MKKKNIFLAILVLALAGLGYGYFQWNKPHKTAEGEKPAASLGASELLAAFETDEQMANATYLEKVIEVKGTVSEIAEEAGNVVIYLSTDSDMGYVSCTLIPGKKTTVAAGENVVVRGICKGYLTDVILEQSTLVE